jgi:putative sterol carrier protein
VRFWSEEFFRAAAETVNSDQRFGAQIAGIKADILAESTDKGPSVIIHVEGGKVVARSAAPGEPAEFTFSAPYNEWVTIIRDSLDIRGEVVKGRVKFKGSMPKMLLYFGRVSRMEKQIIQAMRALGPEY